MCSDNLLVQMNIFNCSVVSFACQRAMIAKIFLKEKQITLGNVIKEQNHGK